MSRLRDKMTCTLMAGVVGLCLLSAASVAAQAQVHTSTDVRAVGSDVRVATSRPLVSPPSQSQTDLLAEDFGKFLNAKSAREESSLRRSADEYNSGRMADADRAELFRRVQAREIVLPSGVALKPYERSTPAALATWLVGGTAAVALFSAIAVLAIIYFRWVKKRAARTIIRLPIHRGLARLCRTIFVILAAVLGCTTVATLLFGSPTFLLSAIGLLLLHPAYILTMWVIEGFFLSAPADVK